MAASVPTTQQAQPDGSGAAALENAFEGDVQVLQIDAANWRLLKDLTYRGRGDSIPRITVPAGSETDFASVPRPFVWLVPRYGLYTPAAILHDYLCRSKSVPKAECDRIFREAMNDLKVAFLRRWIMWAAVRVTIVRGDGLRDLPRWLAIALPAAVFVIVPAAVILVWLALFWVIETIVYWPLRLVGRRPNPPKLRIKLS